MSLFVRPALPAEAAVVCEFNRLLALESEGKTLDPALLERGVRQALADDHKGRYFLAVLDDRIVGQLGITYEWSDWRNGWFWWIQSVYVRPEARRRGVFRALFEHVRESAKADPQIIGIRLYVERENQAAHRTYTSLGLGRTTYEVMERYPL
jgi:GNAT superfamily N-acetyltransferase